MERRLSGLEPPSVSARLPAIRVRGAWPILPEPDRSAAHVTRTPPIFGRDRGRPPRRAPRRRDFLWGMSSDLLLTLPQLLARHGRQVVLLVVRDLAVPHDEDDLQPFRPQRPERLVMRVAPRPLLLVVRAGPGAGEQREEGHLVDHVPQRLVAGEAEVDAAVLAAPFRHGHGARL